MFQRYFSVVAGAALTCLILAGCATVPKVTDPSGVDISVKAMNLYSVRTYYGTNATGDYNPFIPFGGLITRQDKDYVVLRIHIAAARDAVVSVNRILAEDASGARVAEWYTWPRFKRYIESWQYGGRQQQQLVDRAMRAYLPSNTVKVGPGTRNYVVVLIGNRPMPSPVTVVANISVDGGAPRIFRFEAEKLK